MEELCNISGYLRKTNQPLLHAELIDQKLNFLWVFKGFLTGETDNLLIAAQDKTLSTGAMWQIYSATNLPLCYLYGGYDETIEYLISDWGFLEVFQYIMRHNNVAKYNDNHSLYYFLLNNIMYNMKK